MEENSLPGIVLTLIVQKTRLEFLLIIHRTIPYQTAEFKSTYIFAMAIWDPTVNLIPANTSGYTVHFQEKCRTSAWQWRS